MLLSGEMIDAREAERLGLVNRVVPLERLEEETFAFAQKLSSKSPLALKVGKQFCYQMMDMPFWQRMEFATESLAQLCASEDAREGIQAFLEKRQPIWKGK